MCAHIIINIAYVSEALSRTLLCMPGSTGIRETISLDPWLCGTMFSAFLPPVIVSWDNSLLLLRNSEKGNLIHNLRC